MKTSLSLITLSLVVIAAVAAEKPVPGPKGGKMLDAHMEFFVENDRSVVLAFYDADLKPVAVGAQSAVIWADAKSGRVKLALEKKNDALVSTQPLPEGDGYNVMVQLKSTPDAKAQNFKIAFDDEVCAKCQRAEYACICAEEHGHKH